MRTGQVRRNILRALIATLALVLVLCMVVMVTLYVLGLRGITERVLARIATHSQVVEVRREPDGRIYLRGLYLAGTNWQVHANQLWIQPSLLSLLSREVRLNSIVGDTLQITADTHGTGPTKAIHLPLLHIDRLQFGSVAVAVDAVHLTVANLFGRLHGSGTSLYLDRAQGELATAGQQFRLRGADVDLALTAPRRIRSHLPWQRLHMNAPASGVLDLEGELPRVRGRLTLLTPLRARAELSWDAAVLSAQLDPLALGGTQLRDFAARVDFNRHPWPIHTGGSVELPMLGTFVVAVESSWDERQLPLHATFEAATDARGRVGAKNRGVLDGTLDTHDWTARVALSASDVDLAQWVDGADSKLRITGPIEARVTAPLGAVFRLHADGKLRAYPLQAEAAFAIDQSGAHLYRAEFHNRANHLVVRPDGLAMRFDAQLGDLHTLSSQWKGSAHASAVIEGRRGRFELEAQKLAFASSVSLGRLKVSGHADLDRALDATADATAMHIAGLVADAARLHAFGTLARQTLEIGTRNAQGVFDAHLQGGWHAPTSAPWQNGDWIGSVADAQFRTPQYGRWHLRAPASLQLARTRVQIGPLCLDGDAGANLCLTHAGWQNNLVLAGGSWRGVPAAWVPLERSDTFGIDGRIDGNFTLDGRRLDGTAKLIAGDLAVHDRHIALETATASWRWPLGGKGIAHLDAALDSNTLGHIAAHVDRSGNGALAGQILASLHDLAFLQLLASDSHVFQLEGAADLHLGLSGTDTTPRVSGTGRILGSLRVPTLGIAPMPLMIELQGGSERAGFAGSIGGLHVDGSLGLASLTRPTLQAHVTGSNQHLLTREDLAANWSPDVHIAYADNTAEITGKVRLDSADIRFVAENARRGGLSDDVVIHPAIDPRAPPPRARAQPTAPLHWGADVQLTLGDAVHFNASGLKTRLTGELRIQARPPAPLRVTGVVSAVDGTFDTYGVRLALEQARLSFNGPADNPRVDARAVRKLDDNGTDTVGVRITGPLQRMDTQLFSQPARNAEETLALLVTGQSLANSTGAGLQAVGEAGLALGVLDALPVTGRVRESLGLDELDVRSPLDPTTSQIRIGKQITERLRARYVYNVFNRTGGLQLRYKVTRQLSLQTEAGTDSSAVDVLWEWHSTEAKPASPESKSSKSGKPP